MKDILNNISIVLGISCDQLDIEASFIQNGGDSLKATLLVSSFKADGYTVSRENILTINTLRELIHTAHMKTNPSQHTHESSSDPSLLIMSIDLAFKDEQSSIARFYDERDGSINNSSSASLSPRSSLGSSRSGDAQLDGLDEVDCSIECLDLSKTNDSRANDLQLDLIHSTLKDPQKNIISYTMIHHTEHIATLREAWKVVIEREDIFETSWIASLTGSEHPRFLWKDSAEEAIDQVGAKQEPSVIGSLFIVEPVDNNRYTNCSAVTWKVHHALTDGISAGLVLSQVLNIANGGEEQPRNSFWKWSEELQLHKNSNASHAIDFWEQKYETYKNATGSLRLPNSDGEEFEHSKVIRENISGITEGISLAAQESNVTTASVFYAAWAIVLANFSDSFNVVFGAVLSGRNVPIENSHRVIGLLVNPLPFHANIKLDMTVKEFLDSTFKDLLALEGVSWSTPEHGFTRNYDSAISVEAWTNDWDAYDIRPLETYSHQESDVPISIRVIPGKEVTIQYHSDRLKPKDAETIMASYQQALRQLMKVHSTIDHVLEAILSAPSRAVLSSFGNCLSGRTTKQSISQDLVTLFEKVVQNHPKAIAVDDGTTQTTYREFDYLANKVACALSKRISKGDVVCLHSDKSRNWIVGIFGILKAGGIYCSLDPGLPSHLRATIFHQARAKLFLAPTTSQLCATPSYCNTFESIESMLLQIQEQGTAWKHREQSDPSASAYLCFTSGSTGTPKGVMCSHEGLVAFQSDLEVRLFSQPGVRISQVMSVAFDGSIHEIFSALTYGGTLVLQSGGDPFKPLESANAAILTPSIARVLNPDDYPQLKWVYLVGEPVPQVVCDRWASVKTLYNMYGPTEGTCGATIKQLKAGSPITIGIPNPTTRIYILTTQGRLAQPGMIGEIYLAGVQIAQGYVGLPEQTKERFLPDTIMRNGECMYRTGDHGFWNQDGEVVCLGRNDRQIKLRGYRLDLNDLEIRIERATPEITGIALTRQNDDLVAMIQPFDINVEEFKVRVSSILPRYAMPHHIITTEKIPMTSAGKVDYQAIRNSVQRPRIKGNELRTATERLVAKAYREILDIPDTVELTSDSNFIELGGHSLKQMRLTRHLSSQMKTPLSLQLILAQPSIEGMAKAIEIILGGPTTPVQETGPLGPDAVSPIEQEWLQKYKYSKGTASFNVCFAARYNPSIVDVERFTIAWNAVVSRHQILSTRYLFNEGIPKRQIASVPPRVEKLQSIDLWKEANRPFDVAQESLVRLYVSHGMFIIVMSHILADYTTLALLLKEATELYNGQTLNSPPYSYSNTLAWPRKPLKSSQDFWLNYLKDAPLLPKCIRNMPARTSYQGRSFVTILDDKLISAMPAFMARNNATSQQLAIAAVAACLIADSENPDIIIGAPHMNRHSEEDLQTVGLFLEPLPIRITYPSSTSSQGQNKSVSFLESVQCSMRMAFTNAMSWHHILDAVKPSRDYPNHPLFDIMVTFLDKSMMEKLSMDIPSVRPCYLWSNGAKFKLMCEFMEIPTGKLALRIEYDDSSITSEFIRGLVDRLPRAMEQLLLDDLDLGQLRPENEQVEGSQSVNDSMMRFGCDLV